MSDKSLVNAAYEVLTERYEKLQKSEGMPFGELCAEISERVGMSLDEMMDHVSRFYTDMTLDGRFVIKNNNQWVLREHEKYEDVHLDMNQFYEIDNYGTEPEEKKTKDDGDENDDEENNPSDDTNENAGENEDDSNYEDGDDTFGDDEDADEND